MTKKTFNWKKTNCGPEDECQSATSLSLSWSWFLWPDHLLSPPQLYLDILSCLLQLPLSCSSPDSDAAILELLLLCLCSLRGHLFIWRKSIHSGLHVQTCSQWTVTLWSPGYVILRAVLPTCTYRERNFICKGAALCNGAQRSPGGREMSQSLEEQEMLIPQLR